METVCNRLWKRYVTALGNHVKLPKTICNRFRQPLMETVCNRLSSCLPCYATAYRNGVRRCKTVVDSCMYYEKPETIVLIESMLCCYS
jgi:hypothetical protein